MKNAVVDKILIHGTYANGEKRETKYSADMYIDDKVIPVQLQKGYDGRWSAVSEENETVYRMENTIKESINDWRNGEEVEITDIVPRIPS